MFTILMSAALVAGAGPFYLDEDKKACIASPTLNWCRSTPVDTGKDIDRDVLNRYDAKARTWMKYRKGVGFQSHYEDVILNQRWYGNCSDLVVTIADMLFRDGYNVSATYRVAVDSNGDGQFDHLVGAVVIQGETIVFGDVFENSTYRIDHGKWKIKMFAKNDTPLWYFNKDVDTASYTFK